MAASSGHGTGLAERTAQQFNVTQGDASMRRFMLVFAFALAVLSLTSTAAQAGHGCRDSRGYPTCLGR
jgi:hypothetical protein